MGFPENLGVTDIRPERMDSILRDINIHYSITQPINLYNCNLELLSSATTNKRFNNRHSLFKLVKKRFRISYSGIVFKGLIRYKRQHYYRDVFIKEIPIYPLNFNYETNINRQENYSYHKNYYLNNHNSSANIEVFLSYVTSRIFELGLSPTFGLFYGAYSVNLDKFSYMSDKGAASTIDNGTIYNLTDKQIIQKRNCPVYLMALEKFDVSIETLNSVCDLDESLLKSILFQIYAGIFTMYTILGIRHNDLHLGNIMFKITKKKFIYYELNDIYYRIPTYGFLVKIIDWGRGTYNYNNVSGNNSIFNRYQSCDGQLKFGKINKAPLVRKNNWRDIVSITHNFLYNFHQLKYYKLFTKFLKSCLKTKSDIHISIKKFNWETYEHIASNDFNIIPEKIINNTIFKMFVVDTVDPSNTIYKILL